MYAARPHQVSKLTATIGYNSRPFQNKQNCVHGVRIPNTLYNAQISCVQSHRRRTSSSSSLICRAEAAASKPSSSTTPTAALLRFVDTNFIPVALLSAITFGWLCPNPGVFAASHNLQTFSTIGIFIISGLLLQRGEAVAALRSPLALIYGVTSILFLTPLAAFAVLRLPLQPPEIILGLAVFCCVPTTLSTCVTLATACRGNAAVALLLVILTNVLGVFTIPAVLGLVLGSVGGTGGPLFDPVVLFRSLVKTVLLPLLFGVALQVSVPGVSAWRSRNRKLLSYASTLCLCLVPWIQLSVAKTANLALTPASIAAAAVASAGLHLLFLAVNIPITSVLRFNKDPLEDIAIRRAVVLCSSEKTLPVAVATINQLGAVAGAAAGIAVLPCIMAHLLQIAIDSALVSYWNKLDSSSTSNSSSVVPAAS